MIEPKEVYLILFREHSGECLHPHWEFYETEQEAIKALPKVKEWITGKATYVRGVIEAEQMGEWY